MRNDCVPPYANLDAETLGRIEPTKIKPRKRRPKGPGISNRTQAAIQTSHRREVQHLVALLLNSTEPLTSNLLHYFPNYSKIFHSMKLCPILSMGPTSLRAKQNEKHRNKTLHLVNTDAKNVNEMIANQIEHAIQKDDRS